ncbi:MAG: P1 family peptidase [Ardenticatenaceae bacterium]|nr:P1 family peptidase [Ardenticatenaceae bacterium]
MGALVQLNHGVLEELTIAGVPVGQHIQPPQQAKRAEDGSIMIVLATNAPLNGRRQLGRFCRWPRLAYARAVPVMVARRFCDCIQHCFTGRQTSLQTLVVNGRFR